MIDQIKFWLNKPYYSPIYTTYNIIIGISFGIIISIFLIVFQPFRIHLLGENLVLFCLGFGCIATFSIIFILYFLPKIFKTYFNPETRTILKQLILLNIAIIVTASISYPYNIYIRKSIDQEYIAGYFQILAYSYTIGFFPIIFWLYYDEYEIRRIRKSNSQKINNKKEFNLSFTEEENLKTFQSDQSNSTLEIDTNKIVYISSEGNYASFFMDTPKGLKEVIFRITLTQISEELSNQKNIIRCHKSYIINSKYISEYSGNARGYIIKTSKTTFEIPVSRKFSKKDLELFLTY